MQVIAKIHNDFPTKFGLPRQSGLVSEVRSMIVFEPASMPSATGAFSLVMMLEERRDHHEFHLRAPVETFSEESDLVSTRP